MQAYPLYPERKLHDLNRIWDFAFIEDDDSPEELKIADVEFRDRIPVPSAFDAYPSYAGKRGTGVYHLELEVTPGRRGLMRFGGLGLWARVFVDGEALMTWNLPYSGFSVEVPPSDEGTREIVVLVNNVWNTERCVVQEQYMDFYGYGGLYRGVVFEEVGEVYLRRARVRTLDAEEGRIQVTAELGGNTSNTLEEAEIWVDDGGRKKLTDIEVGEDGAFTFEGSIKKPSMWYPHRPALHTITIRVGEDVLIERFGLRTVETEDGEILINGEPLKLLGFNRHESHPQFGPALPEQTLVQDLQLLRELGCNFIRGAHYPQDQRFLDLCDELGFLVFEEALGWQATPEHFQNVKFREAQVEQATQMVRNSFNHPCVIMWGFLNEGDSQTPESRPVYKAVAEAIRETNSGRLVTFASNHPYNELNFDLADVISVNTYPGWYSASEDSRPLSEVVPELDNLQENLVDRGFGDKPLIITEIGAGAIYGFRDSHRAHWSEEYQRDLLELVCTEVVNRKEIAGVAIWQFCDGRTFTHHKVMGRPRGFNNKGIVDEYRRPKLAFEEVKTVFNIFWEAHGSAD